jgi:hypothetical protein
MRLVGAVLGALVGPLSLPPILQAQVNDHSVERVSAAVQHRAHLDLGALSWTDPPPRRFGILTFEPPVAPGEIVRLRFPIGKLVSKAAKGISAANYRRKEALERR